MINKVLMLALLTTTVSTFNWAEFCPELIGPVALTCGRSCFGRKTGYWKSLSPAAETCCKQRAYLRCINSTLAEHCSLNELTIFDSKYAKAWSDRDSCARLITSDLDCMQFNLMEIMLAVGGVLLGLLVVIKLVVIMASNCCLRKVDPEAEQLENSESTGSMEPTTSSPVPTPEREIRKCRCLCRVERLEINIEEITDDDYDQVKIQYDV